MKLGNYSISSPPPLPSTPSQGFAEEVKGHFNANDLKPDFQALKKLWSEPPSQVSAIQTANY